MSVERDELRDDAVARAWREHVRDTPPPALDDAIRAAARRAVGAKPREKAIVAEASSPWRWWMPLAAAATIGAVAIGVLQNMPQEALEPTVVSDAVTAQRAAPVAPAVPMQAAPAKETAPPPEAASAKKKASAAAAEQRDLTPLPMPRTQPQREAPPASAPVPAPVPKVRQDAAKPDVAPQRLDPPSESKETFAVPPPADDRQRAASLADKQEQVAALEKRASKDAELRRNERDAVSGFVASPPASSAPAGNSYTDSSRPADVTRAAAARTKPSAPTVDKSANQSAASSTMAAGARGMAEPQPMVVTPPDVFLAEIRRLLAAGDREGAARELQRFRRTHVDADARLPVELREFAATVPR